MPHKEDFRCRHCPRCGAIIGIAPEREAVAEAGHYGPWDEKFPCVKKHRPPIQASTRRWWDFGLIQSDTITYEDGSQDKWEECGIRGCGYRGLWFWLAGLYVKLSRRKVEPWCRWTRYT